MEPAQGASPHEGAAAPCTLDALPPPALAAVAAHLPALDLLRLTLSSKAAAAALGRVAAAGGDVFGDIFSARRLA